jgi:hypothetical protein
VLVVAGGALDLAVVEPYRECRAGRNSRDVRPDIDPPDVPGNEIGGSPVGEGHGHALVATPLRGVISGIGVIKVDIEAIVMV